MKKLTPFIFILVLLFLFVPAGSALAQLPDFSGPLVPCGTTATGDTGPKACGACDLVSLSKNIINFLVFFATFVAILMFVYAGFMYLTSAGNPAQISSAHKIFANVLIGFIILLAAWLLIDLVMKFFYGGSFGPWNDIICEPIDYYL